MSRRIEKSGSRTASVGKANSQNWPQQNIFIQRELSADEANACKKWDVDSDTAWDMAQKLIETDYNVSLKWDDYNECFGCFITPSALYEGPNIGRILTGRGSTPMKALKQALFKHAHIYQEGEWLVEPDRRGKEIDD